MLEIYDKVDFVCLSKTENVEKPDPRLFEAALRQVNSSQPRGFPFVRPVGDKAITSSATNLTSNFPCAG